MKHGQCCEGSWLDCINPFHNPVRHGYFRHIVSCKHYTPGDIAKLCPICWFEAHTRNTPIPAGPKLSNAWITHLQKYKPEKDSL